MKTFNFINPGKIRLRARFEGENNSVITTSEDWSWSDAGNQFSIKWGELAFHKELEPVLKSFIVHRFESRSPRTVGTMDQRLLYALAKSKLGRKYPWGESEVIQFLSSLKDQPYFFFI